MERLLIEGSRRPLKEITKSNRVVDLQKALQFGNHKSTTNKHHPTPTSLPTHPMAPWNTSHPGKWSTPSAMPYAPLAKRDWESPRKKLVPTQLDWALQWPCTWVNARCTQWCTSANGQATPFFGISENKSWSSATMYQRGADLLELPPCTKLWPSGVSKQPSLNAEMRGNVCGDTSWLMQLSAFSQFS